MSDKDGVSLWVKLDADMATRLGARCAAERRPKAQVVRAAIDAYIMASAGQPS
jgi:predicted DNA-binding protein